MPCGKVANSNVWGRGPEHGYRMLTLDFTQDNNFIHMAPNDVTHHVPVKINKATQSQPACYQPCLLLLQLLFLLCYIAYPGNRRDHQ